MKLGFYGNYTKRTAEFAHNTGFRSMELSAWPTSTLNAYITDRELLEIRKDLDEKDIEVSALGYYPNYLAEDKAEAEEARAYFLKVLDLAKRMEVKTVATFVGRNPELTVEANLPEFKEVFSRFVDEAAKRNLRIAIENCPMMNHRTMKSSNLAYSPEIWDMMFNIIPAANFGLEIDPAHMLWQGIDYVKAIHDFGPRIFHAHAKDTEILPDVLARCGIYGLLFEDHRDFGHGWWRGRVPGWGSVNWKAFITALLDVGYTGNVDIEHEDEVFARAANLNATIKSEGDIINNYSTEESGLLLGYNTLSVLIPQER